MRRRRAQAGFTLMEIMIATAILALSLTVLVESTGRAVTSITHAKLVTTASFLARGRLVELEDELAEKGFTDEAFSKETSGTFEERGFKRFTWATIIDKVELPSTEDVQNLMSKAVEAKQTAKSGDPFAAPQQPAPSAGGAAGGSAAGLMGAGAFSSQFGMVKSVLEQGIRRAKVTVSWVERGKTHSIEVYEYLVDPRRVDMAMGGMAGLAGMVPGAQGDQKSGTGGTGSTGGTGGMGAMGGVGGAAGGTGAKPTSANTRMFQVP